MQFRAPGGHSGGDNLLLITADRLRSVSQRIFASVGAPEDIAAHVAGSLVESNLAGHDSHGVIRVPAYVDAIRRGLVQPAARPSIISETETTALVAGNWAFGQVAATYATEIAIAKARECHVAAVGVVQCPHIGRLGEYAELAARANLIAMVTVGGFTGGAAAPFGGAGRVMPTNPFAFGVPAERHEPMLVDFATTMVAEGKLQMLRAKHEPAPAGWLLDKHGNPTTNVEDFYAGGMLLPFGGHKGYGLGMVAEVLSGALPGVDEYREGRGGSGTFILIIDPAIFRPFAAFAGSVDAFFDKVKAVPAAPGFSEVLVPGEPEHRSKERRLAEGIPVPEETWSKIAALTTELSLQV